MSGQFIGYHHLSAADKNRRGCGVTISKSYLDRPLPFRLRCLTPKQKKYYYLFKMMVGYLSFFLRRWLGGASSKKKNLFFWGNLCYCTDKCVKFPGIVKGHAWLVRAVSRGFVLFLPSCQLPRTAVRCCSYFMYLRIFRSQLVVV